MVTLQGKACRGVVVLLLWASMDVRMRAREGLEHCLRGIDASVQGIDGCSDVSAQALAWQVVVSFLGLVGQIKSFALQLFQTPRPASFGSCTASLMR